MDIKELKIKSKNLEPVVRIGKNGINPHMIAEIDRQLDRNELIKIKLLQAFVYEHDKKETAVLIANATNSQLVSQVGSTITLYRKKTI